VPPFSRPVWLRAAPAFERIGGRLALPGAGIQIVEATKQLYRPVGVRRVARRPLPQLEPAVVPAAGSVLRGPQQQNFDDDGAAASLFGLTSRPAAARTTILRAGGEGRHGE